MKRSHIIIFFVAIVSFNCKKDNNGNTVADIPGVITITIPGGGAIYMNGSNLRVEGEMTDNNNLSTAKLEIKNKTTGTVLNQQSSTTGSVSFYRFAWNWTVTGVSSTFTATVKVTAVDKQNNQVSKEVDVTLTN